MTVQKTNCDPLKLVVIDDDQQNLELIRDGLDQEGLEIITSEDPQAGMDLVLRLRPAIVLVDLRMPRLGGMEILDRIVKTDPTIEVLLMTAHYSTDSAVEAIQKGAADYLNKPLSIESLRVRIGQVLTAVRRRQKTIRLDEELLASSQFEGLVGRSPAMMEVFARMMRVAPHFRTILVTGATGTGKELVARALHKLSPVAAGPFVVCNCSAIVETLFESELFGHMKGSFTGATQDHAGLFESAHGGTLFLDEIGELPLATQAKLLRVIQNLEIQRVGSSTARRVDVRVIAATNRDLRDWMAQKQFREDLYFRLSNMEIHLPRLAERLEDLPLLERHFLEQYAALYKKPIRGTTRRAQLALARYPWPGNVRELEHVIANACLMTEGEVLDAGDLPEPIRSWNEKTDSPRELLSMAEIERRHALHVLDAVDGNKARAAEILGIGRTTLYRLLEDLDSYGRPKSTSVAAGLETSNRNA
ncbi:MAG: sigma-54-dependent Fis family transcriptional regulator [Acidobacteria bacterium]|nr:sigma-54-dependent Fis family transcriptional regulator [Acidobacteriota bacterium]